MNLKNGRMAQTFLNCWMCHYDLQLRTFFTSKLEILQQMRWSNHILICILLIYAQRGWGKGPLKITNCRNVSPLTKANQSISLALSISLSLLLLIMQELLEQIALTTGFLYDVHMVILRHHNFQTFIAIPSIPLRVQRIMFPQPLFTAYHFACSNVHYCFAAVTIIALTACACSNFTNPKHSGSCKTKLQYRKNC